MPASRSECWGITEPQFPVWWLMRQHSHFPPGPAKALGSLERNAQSNRLWPWGDPRQGFANLSRGLSSIHEYLGNSDTVYIENHINIYVFKLYIGRDGVRLELHSFLLPLFLSPDNGICGFLCYLHCWHVRENYWQIQRYRCKTFTWMQTFWGGFSDLFRYNLSHFRPIYHVSNLERKKRLMWLTEYGQILIF